MAGLMETIPKQLQNDKFRFVKINNKQKRPYEKSWQKNRNYKYNDPALLDHINMHNNYGIICGHGNLLGIDCDDSKAALLVEKFLQETFTVLTGSGKKHYYYYCKNGVSRKIFKSEVKDTFVDLQFTNKLLVCPGSIHPNGNKYTVIKDLPFAEIKYIQVLECFKEYLDTGKTKPKRTGLYSVETDPICKEIKHRITMADLLLDEGIDASNRPTLCPWHESKGGRCFDFTDETFHCFHCGESGSLFDFYMKCNNKSFPTAKRELAEKAGIKTNKKSKGKRSFSFKQLSKETDFIEIAKKFIKVQPIWYDDSKLWWLWDNRRHCWVIRDEIDIMNNINKYSRIPNVNPGLKACMLEALKMEGRLNKPKKPDSNWVQFGDAIINIRTGRKFEATPSHFFTNPIPWKIGESIDTPTIDKLFEEWVGLNYKQTLYEIVAYCVLCDYPIHRMFCFVGTGSNGKTCFLNLICKFVGDKNVASTDLDTLLKSRFETSRLYKKLVCLIGETNLAKFEKTSIIKRLTGQDLIPTEYKNKKLFESYNYAKILIATNNLPPTVDTSSGFYRRMLVINFPNQFTEKLDVLSEIPPEEYENLAKNVISILRKLLRKREFHNEGTIEEREQKYEELSNPFDKFWEENIMEDYDSYIPKQDFKSKLDQWCRNHKRRSLDNGLISRSIKEKSIEDSRLSNNSRVRVWCGISWKK